MGQVEAGTPLITHDPASVNDIQVVENIDTTIQNYVRLDYGTAYAGVVNAASGAILYAGFPLIDEQTLDFRFLRRVWQSLPGSWLYDRQVDVDSRALVFTKQRKNIGVNIQPSAIIYTGQNASIVTLTLVSGGVHTLRIDIPGTGFGEFVYLRFSPPSSGRTAQGYATTTNGTITGYVIIDPGTGYTGGGPSVDPLASTLVTTERKDINTFVAYEIVTITTDSPYNEEAHALISEKSGNRSFPARLDLPVIETMYPPFTLGYQSETGEDIPIFVHMYWVMSPTQPALDLDTIYPQDLTLQSNSGSPLTFTKILHDAAALPYTVGMTTYLLYFPATQPSFSEYTGKVYLVSTIDVNSYITLTNGSANVVGSGTNFLTTAAPGLDIMGTPELEIDTVVDDINLTLVTPWAGVTQNIIFPYVINTAIAWVGNLKNVDGEAVPERGGFDMRWRVTKEFMIMR